MRLPKLYDANRRSVAAGARQRARYSKAEGARREADGGEWHRRDEQRRHGLPQPSESSLPGAKARGRFKGIARRTRDN